MGEHVHAHLAITADARELGAAVGQTAVRISDTTVHAAVSDRRGHLCTSGMGLERLLPEHL